MGLIIAVVVHCAGIQDRDGAKLVCMKLVGCFPRLRLIWADGGYAGKLIDWMACFAGWTLQIVKRSDAARGFEVLPRRWVVERTFGWLMKFRRLSKDYEETIKSSEAWILLAMHTCPKSVFGQHLWQPPRRCLSVALPEIKRLRARESFRVPILVSWTAF